MRGDLDEVLDHFKIKQVLERYCRGIDRCDQELVDSVYWPEAIDDHGVWKGPGPEFGAFIVPLIRQLYTATMHIISQSNIAINGRNAAAETYCTAMHRADENGKTVTEFAYCRYVDRFEKRGDEWRIIHRVVVMDSSMRIDEAVPSAIKLNDFARGAADRSDPSYEFYKKAGASLL